MRTAEAQKKYTDTAEQVERIYTELRILERDLPILDHKYEAYKDLGKILCRAKQITGNAQSRRTLEVKE